MLLKTLKVFLILLIIGAITTASAGVPSVSKNGPIRIGPPPPPAWSPSDEDSSIFYEDFESGWGDWTHIDVTAAGIQWHADDFNAYEGNSWWCGDSLLMGYDNHWLQYLVTPTLDFSDVTNPTLTFMMFYAVEDTDGVAGSTGGEYDGWDGCNVWASINNGASWVVAFPSDPPYTSQSMYSFGFEWGMGLGIAGWGGSSGGWREAVFDLTPAAGFSQVKFRFAFCSDPALCTTQNPDLIGYFVDNISIDDGATNLLSNNADDIAFPGDLTFDVGASSGDYWEINDNTSHSPTHSANCVIAGHYNLSNALVTPWISLPEGFSIYYTFWLWCDMLDFTGSGGPSLEDYYIVEGTTDGVIWLKDEFGFHDYGDVGRPGAATVGWEEYLPGDPYNGNMQLDLSAYAGQDVKLRWRVVTDGDDNGGIGTGLHIDDFNMWVSSLLNNDVGATNLHIPFPTSLSHDSLRGTVDLVNYGRLDQTSVASFVRVDSSAPMPLIPWASINAGETITKNFSLTLPEEGAHWMDSYTQLMGDENTANDSTFAGYVTITPEHIYELGYDGRGMTVPFGSLYYWQYDPGNGAMCRFVPADHNIPEAVDITEAKFYFYSPGTFTFHLYDAGTASAPGSELASFDVEVTFGEIRPNWKLVDLSAITEMQNRTEPFWIWAESQNPNAAQIMGDDLHFGEGYYFTYNGASANASENYEFFIRVTAVGMQGVNDDVTLNPYSYALEQNYPNPFNPTTSITFSLAKAGHTTLNVYNILGEEVAELVNGEMDAGIQEAAFDASALSSGIYFYRLKSGDFAAVKKMVLMK